MPVYTVWELRQLDPHGSRGAASESGGLSIEAENIEACAEQVRRLKKFIRHGIKEFLIVERGYEILPGGGPLIFHGAEISLAIE